MIPGVQADSPESCFFYQGVNLLTKDNMRMKKLVFTWGFLILFLSCFPQNSPIRENQKILKAAPDDTIKVQSYIDLSGNVLRTDAEEALDYAEKALKVAEKLNFQRGQAYALKSVGMAYYFQGKYLEAVLYWQQALAVFQKIDDKLGVANMLNNLGAINFNQGDDEIALNYYLQSLKVSEEVGDKLRIVTALLNIGAVYSNKPNTHDLALKYYLRALPLSLELGDQDAIGTLEANIGELYLASNENDEALDFFEKALDALKKTENGNVPFALYNIGRAYTQRKEFDRAIYYQQEALSLAEQMSRKKEMAQALLGLADAYRQNNQAEEAIAALLRARDIAQDIGGKNELEEAYGNLASLYSQRGDYKNAYNNQVLYTAIKDTLYNADMDKQIQYMSLRFDLDKKQGEIDMLEKDKEQKIQQSKNQKLWIFSISGAFFSALLLSFILYRNNQHKQKSNALLRRQKEELQTALEKLRATQTQLIQAEKMASLGELTAGIAHEIQNPLNFVNNFSEVSAELIDEMNTELEKGDMGEVRYLADMLKQNMEKINFHGKRADGIVKGMLQHSRSSSGTKEATDINTLADEYLRLSYHGLRAKDKTFNSAMKTDYDPDLSKINVIRQDLGRVILNLLTNAFYAVNERKKTEPEGYEPTVSISTIRNGKKVIIKIADNGTGIPESVKSKIFQPFFTTKPTGEGTGLGLSLSYDIITKGHGGELKLETEQGKGTEFSIYLPI